jgi:hypothetical protein
MPIRARTPTIASSSAPRATVKPEPGSVIIKQEPTEDDSQPDGRHASNALLLDEMLHNLSIMYDDEIYVHQTVEHGMNSSCCDQPLEFDEPVLTTYKRGNQEVPNFEGRPTSFATQLDGNGIEMTQKKRAARWYHTANPACRSIAVEQEEDDMWFVKRGRPDGGRLLCDPCGIDTSVAGRREPTQITIGTDGPTYVFCTDDCVRAHHDQLIESLVDTKGSMGDGKVNIQEVINPVQFRVVTKSSLFDVCDRLGEDRNAAGKRVAAPSLLSVGDTGALWI